MAKDTYHFKKERLGGSLVIRIVLICLALLIFPLILHTFFYYHQIYKETIDNHLRDIVHIGKSSETGFSEWLIYYERTIHTISTSQHPEEVNFKKLAQDLKLSSLFRMVESNGVYVVTHASNEKRVGQRDLFYSEISTMREGEPKVFAAYDPIEESDQILVAIQPRVGEVWVLGKTAASWINRFAEAYKEYFPYRLTFVDNQGKVLATNDPNYTPTGAEFFSLQQLEGEKLAFHKSKATFFFLDIPFQNTNFSLDIGFSKKEVQQKTLFQLLIRLAVFCFLVFFLGGGLVWWMTKKMMRPLQELYYSMQQVGMGNVTQRYHQQPWGFEINKVGGFFNQTVDNLASNMKRVEEERIKSETYQKELSIAREIQYSLFPKVIPTFPSIILAALYLPAKVVSGDFYDIFPVADRLMIVVADASGKGVSASLYSLGVRSYLRSASTEFDTLEEIVSSANQLFCLDTQESGSFVTAWIALYDKHSKHLQYTSCGHNPIYLRHVNGDIEELSTEGMALGVSSSEKITVKEKKLHVGDSMLLYTDGLVEAQNPETEFFGKERVFEHINFPELLPPQDFLDKLLADLNAFTQGADQFDDITMVSIQIVPP